MYNVRISDRVRIHTPLLTLLYHVCDKMCTTLSALLCSEHVQTV
jgi:hypothetical protein